MIRCKFCGEREYPGEIQHWREVGQDRRLAPLAVVCVDGEPHRFGRVRRPALAKRMRGIRLNYRRDLCGLSLRDVERLTGIPALTVRRHETGVQEPTRDELARLVALYGRPANMLPLADEIIAAIGPPASPAARRVG